MSTIEHLFSFVEHNYNVVLTEHPFWSEIITKSDCTIRAVGDLEVALIKMYPQYLRRDAALAEVVDPLFMAMCMHAIKNVHPKFGLWSTNIMLFRTWVQEGARDISDSQAALLGNALLTLFNTIPITQHDIVGVVLRCEKLWPFLEHVILRVAKDANNTEYNQHLFQIAAFRYNPQDHDLQGRATCSQMYDYLCGANAQKEASFLGMRNILKGPHNNALAWHTALAVCDLKDPTIVGSWMKMSPTFSALRLDPKDQDAWRFWHLLSECTKGDGSGQELLAFLGEDKKDMASAFADGWSIVDALYEGDERYEQAACIMHNSNIKDAAVPLPENAIS